MILTPKGECWLVWSADYIREMCQPDSKGIVLSAKRNQLCKFEQRLAKHEIKFDSTITFWVSLVRPDSFENKLKVTNDREKFAMLWIVKKKRKPRHVVIEWQNATGNVEICVKKKVKEK